MTQVSEQKQREGLLLIDKPPSWTSFYLVKRLRALSNIQKIGHAGTLDPFATGVMVLLVGKKYTRLSDQFLSHDKEYAATIELGKSTSTYDPEGEILSTSDTIPSLEDIEKALLSFQGTILQVPPMYSAKKVGGKKLYELARKGIEIERKPCTIEISCNLLSYDYPNLKLSVQCSKGTYIRSLAHDLGQKLTCGGFLKELTRTRSGPFTLNECLDGNQLQEPTFDFFPYLREVTC